MPVRLTETAINKAVREAPETGRKDLADAGCPGLRLRVTPAGGVTWALACRDRHGRMRRFSLGTFPTMGISEARTEARVLHTKVKREGADPTAQARRERAMSANARAGVGTLAAVLELYAEKRGSAQKAWPQARKRIEALFRPLLQKPAEALTAADFQMLADRHPAASTASLAVRSVRPVLKWASTHGRRYLAAEVGHISPPAAVRRRKRVLDRGELARLLPVLRASDRPYGAAMRFMLLTLTRRQETALARWSDVDLERGTWKLRETKNDRPHTVPLPHQAVALLRARSPRATTATRASPTLMG